jgi:hypothetical protein
MSGLYNKKSSYGLEVDYYDLKKEKNVKFNTFNKMTKLSFIDKDYYKKSVYNILGGTYNDLNLYSEHYFESLIRNIYLVDNFFANSVAIQVNAGEDIILFDNYRLSLPSIVSETQNDVFSGDYLVGGIVHHISTNGIYKKMVSLHRNGMNQSTSVEIPRVA